MTWGKQLEFLLDLKKDGMDPQALRDRPVLDRVEAYYMEVFASLSDSRRHTYGQPVSIPLSEVLAYCQMFYIESIMEREALVRAIRAMDNAYLAVLAQQAEQAKPASQKTSG